MLSEFDMFQLTVNGRVGRLGHHAARHVVKEARDEEEEFLWRQGMVENAKDQMTK